MDPTMINILDVINFAIPAWRENVIGPELREEIVDTIGKVMLMLKLKDDTIPVEPISRKEALITSKTLVNFVVQFEKATPELLDAIKKVRDKLQVDLNLKKK
ncbi:uncharacterized protein LOC107019323 [Solanum pennellii]|uniref:Uncharacterized protein LOC107019323 n=1 Tax=Solanum pennellii TaxID=28526 RepID=A0ABM1GSP1_SOLPN|nr:uncharacterized protein LOC107019323 [Solanum pennellii]